MPCGDVPISLKVQLSSKSCGLVGNVCDACLAFCVLVSICFCTLRFTSVPR